MADGSVTQARIPGPLRGASDLRAYLDQPGDVCPPDALRNVVPFDVDERRARLGQRPGLKAEFPIGDSFWKAPSYIQGMASLNVAEQTLLVAGGDGADVLADGDGVPAYPTNYNVQIMDNLNFPGQGDQEPPTLDRLNYLDFYGDFDSHDDWGGTPGDQAEGLTSPAVRWDRHPVEDSGQANNNNYSDEVFFALYNFYVQLQEGSSVSTSSAAQWQRRVRIVAYRRHLTTLRYEVVNEVELSDSQDAASGTINLDSVLGIADGAKGWDVNKMGHITASDIDVGPDNVYVAASITQTTNEYSDGPGPFVEGGVTSRYGAVFSIPKAEFEPGATPTYGNVKGDTVDDWARQCLGVRYRKSFASEQVTNYNGTNWSSITTYSGDDVLVLVQGRKDYQTGIARYDPSLLGDAADANRGRRRFGEAPTFHTPGHGALTAVGAGKTLAEHREIAKGNDPTLAPSDVLLDGDHGMCRLSVVTNVQSGPKGIDNDNVDIDNTMTTRWTKGCYPLALDVDQDSGVVYVVRTSTGWGVPTPDGVGGYTNNYTDLNEPTDNVENITVMALTKTGQLLWEQDAGMRTPDQGYAVGTAIVYNDRYRPTYVDVAARNEEQCAVCGVTADDVKNFRLCGRIGSSALGKVIWSRFIGVPNGEVEDTGGNTTEEHSAYGDPAETRGVGELTMLSVVYNAQDDQFAVTGENFRKFEVKDNLTSTNPPGTNGVDWHILDTSNFIGRGPANLWKFDSAGVQVWKAYPDADVVGLAVDSRRPADAEDGQGGYLAFLHSTVNSSTRDSGSSEPTDTTGWTYDAGGDYWWLSNHPTGVRQAVILDTPIEGQDEYRLASRKRKHEIRALVRCSGDGQNGWEVGVWDDGTSSDNWRCVIRKIKNGEIDSTPVNVSLAAANLNEGQTYTLRVRIIEARVEVYFSTQPDQVTPFAEHIMDEFLEYKNIGWVSDFQTFDANGKDAAGSPDQIVRVSNAELVDLVSQEVQQARILAMFSDGRLFVSKNGAAITEVAGLEMRKTGLISAQQYAQKLYILDGENARIYDPIQEDLGSDPISDWTATSGDLPGAEDKTSTSDSTDVFGGTTSAKYITLHLDRLYLYGMDDDPLNAVACAAGDPLDFDDTSELVGAAFKLTTERAGVVGRPIIGLDPYNDDYMLVNVDGQVWTLTGDPALEGSGFLNVSRATAAVNNGAVTFNDEGLAVVITDQGVAAVGGTTLEPFSKDILRKYARPDSHAGPVRALAVRDGSRYGSWLFYTTVNAASGSDSSAYYTTANASLHLWWDERARGFFPVVLPEEAGPTAVLEWDGRVLLGGRDGYVRSFDASRKSDFGAGGADEAIEAYFPYGLIHDSDLRNMAFLSEAEVYLDLDSDGATMYYRRANTPEGVYDTAPGAGDQSVTLEGGRTRTRTRYRGAFILLEFYNNTLDEWFAVEGLQTGVSLAGPYRASLADSPPTQPPTDNIGSCPTSTSASASASASVSASASESIPDFTSSPGGSDPGGGDVSTSTSLSASVSGTTSTPPNLGDTLITQ